MRLERVNRRASKKYLSADEEPPQSPGKIHASIKPAKPLKGLVGDVGIEPTTR
jgi:hypothetical protein